MSYDMTLGNAGYGFGGGSGLSGWLGNIGNGWQNSWHNNMRFATDLYNFTDRNLLAPSALNAKIGQNNVLQQQNQAQYQDLVNHNEMWGKAHRLSSGNTALDLVNQQAANTQNLGAQQYVSPVNNAPSTTTTTPYGVAHGISHYGPVTFSAPTNSQQLQAYLGSNIPWTVKVG